LFAVIAACLTCPAGAAEHVVSLNLCTDQMLVLLAPEKIAALSPLARDPALSFVAARAASFPVVRPSAEAVLRLHPDLVLAARYGAQTVLGLLEDDGVPVLRAALPEDFAGIRAETRTLARRLDAQPRGEALIAAMDATLAGLPKRTRRTTALAWEPRFFTAGPGSLMDALMRAAGLINVSDGRRVGLEALLRHPPDLLIVPDAPAYPSLGTDMLQNPAIRAIERRALPPALTLCAGPFSALAARELAR
jgi:iron complex transport system substrate-binding protein